MDYFCNAALRAPDGDPAILCTVVNAADEADARQKLAEAIAISSLGGQPILHTQVRPFQML